MSKKVAFVLFKVENYSQQLLEVYTEPLWFTDQCKFGKEEKTQMVEDMFLFIDVCQRQTQSSFWGLRQHFPPLATYIIFIIKNINISVVNCMNTEHFPNRQQDTIGYKTESLMLSN